MGCLVATVKHLPVLLICAALGVLLLPELAGTPDLNDDVLHLTLINGMSRASNPFDFWSPEIALGEPIARLYQPGSHLLVLGAWWLLFKSVEIATVFLWIKFLAIALLPLSFYACASLLGLERPVPLAAALLCPLVSGDSFGLDLGSYVWAGHGLYPQLVATHGLLLSIGFGWRLVRFRHRNHWPTVGVAALLGFTFWCNFLYGYVAALSLVLMALMPGELSRRSHFRAVFRVGALSFVLCLPKLWVWFADRNVLAAGETGSRQYMADSWGVWKVLQDLFTGQIFDHGRLPVLTLMVGVIVALLLWNPGKAPWSACVSEKFVAIGFGFWLVLYFGRPAFGPLLYLIGITPAMPLHRLIGVVQIFGVLVAAVALGVVWMAPKRLVLTVCMTVCILAAPMSERMVYLEQNRTWARQTRQAFQSENADIESALSLAKHRGGRVYAGFPLNWGGTFKVGAVPVYSLFPVRGIPSVGYLYVGFLRANGLVYEFDWTRPGDYTLFDVRTVIAPPDAIPPRFLERVATFGRFLVYAGPSDSEMLQNPNGTFTLKSAWHPGWRSCGLNGVCRETGGDSHGFTVGRWGRFEYRP